MKRLIKFALGLTSLVIGISLLLFAGYGFIAPNDHLRLDAANLPGLILPIILVWFGWDWMKRTPEEQEIDSPELVLSIKLSDEAYGTDDERQHLLELKHTLEKQLQLHNAGTFDGEEFGNGECNMYIQTTEPDIATKLMNKILTSHSKKLDYSLK